MHKSRYASLVVVVLVVAQHDNVFWPTEAASVRLTGLS